MIVLASILVLGILAQWIAWKIKIPAIFPLILIGLLVGPISSLITGDGSKLVDPEDIFAGKMMYYFVSLAVGVILFEGGLTLKFKEVRHVARTVRNLVLVGTVVMLVGGGLAAHFIMGMNMRIAFLFGALIIVTGPTVIAPILASVRPNSNVSTILKWESILIDPVGAIVAVLIYEVLFAVYLSHGGGNGSVVVTFLIILLAGVAFGLAIGFFLYFLLKRKLLPEFLINVVSLGLVVLAFAGAEVIQSESGLLSVTIMGIFLANVNPPNIDKILDFKESLTVILISLLFIILASNIDIAQMQMLGVEALIVFLIVVFVLRPVAVFLSARGSSLNFKEKIFISWIGPKGIVAAAVASIFSLYLLEKSDLPPDLMRQVEILVPLVFAIILGTVTLNGLTAKWLANVLGVVRKDSTGFLIVGANEIAITVARYLQLRGVPVTLIDSSKRNLKAARAHGLHAIKENVLSDDLNEDLILEDVGQLLALTSSNDINIFSCRRFREQFGREKVFRLITVNEMKFASLQRPTNILFGGDADYINMIELLRKYPDVQELKLQDQDHLMTILQNEEDDCVPLFVRSTTGDIKVVTAHYTVKFEVGDMLAYIGNAEKYIN